ncbi:MAG: tetratricopeptide repeat protein [Pseudomonadota bacterium]
MPSPSWRTEQRDQDQPASPAAGRAFLCKTTLAWAAPDEARIAALISAGRIDEARQVLEASNPSEADRRFFEARLAKARGDLDAAIRQFRAVLSADPRHLNARRKLAHSLMLAEQYDSAEFHFRELIRIDPSPRLVAQYRQFLAVIDDNQPLSMGVFGAVLPSTNVNRGSTSAVFDTDIG